MGYHKAMQKYIDSQVRYWKEQKEGVDLPVLKAKRAAAEKKDRPFITLSREYGSGAYEIGEKIIMLINEKYKSKPEWAAYDKKLLDNIVNDLGISETLAESLTSNTKQKLSDFIQTFFSKFPPQVAVYRKLTETMRRLAINGHVVLVGRASNMITRDIENGFHVRIVAPVQYRAGRISSWKNISMKEAEQIVTEKNKERDSFIKEFVKFDNTNPLNYHITVNLGQMSINEAAAVIVDSMKDCGYL
jgi:cytidylate kinase